MPFGGWSLAPVCWPCWPCCSAPLPRHLAWDQRQARCLIRSRCLIHSRWWCRPTTRPPTSAIASPRSWPASPLAPPGGSWWLTTVPPIKPLPWPRRPWRQVPWLRLSSLQAPGPRGSAGWEKTGPVTRPTGGWIRPGGAIGCSSSMPMCGWSLGPCGWPWPMPAARAPICSAWPPA